jgi:hypothetical protein
MSSLTPDGSYDLVVCGPPGLVLYAAVHRLLQRRAGLRIAVLEDTRQQMLEEMDTITDTDTDTDGSGIDIGIGISGRNAMLFEEDKESWDLLRRLELSDTVVEVEVNAEREARAELFVQASMLSSASSEAEKLVINTACIPPPSAWAVDSSIDAYTQALPPHLQRALRTALRTAGVRKLFKIRNKFLVAAMKRMLASASGGGVTFIPARTLEVRVLSSGAALTTALYHGHTDRLIRLASAVVVFAGGQAGWAQVDFTPPLPLAQALAVRGGSGEVAVRVALSFSSPPWAAAGSTRPRPRRFVAICDKGSIIRYVYYSSSGSRDGPAEVGLSLCGRESVEQFLTKGGEEERKLFIINEVYAILTSLENSTTSKVAVKAGRDTAGASAGFVLVTDSSTEGEGEREGEWDLCDESVENLNINSVKSSDEWSKTLLAYRESSVRGGGGLYQNQGQHTCVQLGLCLSSAQCTGSVSIEALVKEGHRMADETLTPAAIKQIELRAHNGRTKTASPPLAEKVFFFFLLLIGIGCILTAVYYLSSAYYSSAAASNYGAMDVGADDASDQKSCDTGRNAMKYSQDS